MLGRLLSLPKSKKGFWGTLFFFYAGVRIIFDFWQGADFAMNNADSLAGYLATGPGNLIALVIGIFLIVWALFTQQSESKTSNTLLSSDFKQKGGESEEQTGVPSEHLTDKELQKRFYAQSLKPIRGANFIDQRVPLDGFLYEQCTFERCTFVYRGEKPFGLADFVVKGNDNNIEARGPGLHAFSMLLVALKYINPQIEVDKSLQSKDVAMGYRFIPNTNQSSSEGSEKEALQQETEKLRAENERLKAVNSGQQEQLSNWEGDRRRLKEFLTEAWREGTNLRGSKPSKEEAQEWENHVRYLLEQAIGKEIADKVLRHDPHYQSGDFDASDAQKFLEMRLHRVERLQGNVAKQGAIPFRTGFAPYDWKDWKSPPQSTIEARLEELEAENENLKKGVRSFSGTVGDWENRKLLKRALAGAYREGLFWRNSSDEESTSNWANRTRQLIDAAFGKSKVDRFLEEEWGRWIDNENSDAERQLHQKWVDERLTPLGELIREVDSLKPLNLQPGFDGREWVSEN